MINLKQQVMRCKLQIELKSKDKLENSVVEIKVNIYEFLQLLTAEIGFTCKHKGRETYW